MPDETLFDQHKRIARDNPCYLAMETQDPAFIWDEGPWRHGLTVDAGYMNLHEARPTGGPVWHLVVSYQGELEMPSDRELIRYGVDVMGDLGDGHQAWHDLYWYGSSRVFHLRRRMTREEQGSLATRDIRGTAEARARAKRARKAVPRQTWAEDFVE